MGTAGSYVLLLRVDEAKEIEVGGLGVRSYAPGNYLYCGSALNGLEGRLARHLRQEKRLHWHIDYLLPFAQVVEVWVLRSSRRLECDARQVLCGLGGVPQVGFGSSDCTCPGHLLFFVAAPTLDDFNRALARGCPAAPSAQRWAVV